MIETVRIKLENWTMLKRFTHIALAASLLLLVTGAALPSPQEKAQKTPKDQQEYELINQAFKETDPAKKIQLLQQWKDKYPETAFSVERVQQFMAAYQATNQGAKAIASAKELLKLNPGDFSAYVTITTTTPSLGKTDAATLGDGESAAAALIKTGLAQRFQAANKPATVSDAQWNDAKKQIEGSAHQTLGWIAMQRKDHKGAEAEFKKVLGLNPSSGQVSYWLGSVVLAQRDPKKNTLAMFSFARAAVYDGPGALAPDGRTQVDEYLGKVYESYAGTTDGLEELKAMAKSSPLPPAGMADIESAAVRKFKADQKSRAENPKRWIFLDLKAGLLGAQGDSIWSDLKGKLTPETRLFVVSAVPAARPQTINLSSEKGGAIEVVLKLENRLRQGVGSGREVSFEGVAVALTKSPFRLTLNDGKLK